MRIKISPFAYGKRFDPSLLIMVKVNGVWVWIGEYYTDEYKKKGGVIDVYG